MHHCLQIQEIVANVASYGTNNDLTKMGLVCHAFYEPAMDMLWRDLPGMAPLIMCLPEDSWKLSSDAMPEVTREIKPNEWSRFRFHARRVRELKVPQPLGAETGSRFYVHTSCWEALREAFQDQEVFPRLCKLHWQDSVALDYVKMFLQPSLRSFILEYRSDEESKTALIVDMLRDRSPSLQRLIVLSEDHIGSPKVLESLMPAIRSQYHLVALQISGPFDRETLLHVASLPSLKALACHLSNADYGDMLASLEGSPRFPSLQALDITSCAANFGPLLAFLASIPPTQLFEINIRLEQFHEFLTPDAPDPDVPRPTAQNMSALFKALSRFTSLRRLRVDCPPGESVDAEFLINDEVMAPLTALSELRMCDLDYFPVNLSESFINKLACSWRKAMDLKLGSKCWVEDEDFGINPQYLLPFTGAAYLTHLAIRLGPPAELTEDFELPFYIVNMRMASRLRELSVDRSPLKEEDVGLMAAYLAHTFPRATVEHTWPSDDEMNERYSRLNTVKSTITKLFKDPLEVTYTQDNIDDEE